MFVQLYGFSNIHQYLTAVLNTTNQSNNTIPAIPNYSTIPLTTNHPPNMFSNTPKTPQRPTTSSAPGTTVPGAPLREIPPFHHHNRPSTSSTTAAAVSTASRAPCTPPRSRAPLPALTAPPNQKTLNSLGKMRYRWNDPNLGARYRGVDKDLGVKGSTADYAYPVLQMGSEPARGVVRRRREGSGQGQGL